LDDRRRARQSNEETAQRQKPFAEQERQQATENPERRVREEFRGMHEMVGRHVKQRFVAQNGPLDDHRCDRRHDGRSQ
jgi:hypothetical protein